MLIEIVEVNKEDKGKYQQLNVTYRSNGKIAEKKLMSFTNPAVFKAIEKMEKGATVDVNTAKNDKGFWDWTGINEGGAQVATKETPSATRVTGSNYETKEERAVRQRYIVRQSSLTNAISALSVGAKSPIADSDILSLAKKFEAYVFEEPTALEKLINIEDDIPL